MASAGAVRSQPASTPASATPTPRSQPVQASGKRKRESNPTPGSPAEAEEVVERKYGLDIDLLKCPVCSEPFSAPVYQCPSGHTACSACCKNLAISNKRCPTCSLQTGSIRCIAIEKILESLLASCKYAPNGCKEMLKQADIKKHERDECKCKPFRCPFTECRFEGSSVTLPVHLTEEHRVRTVEHNNISGAGFRMESSDCFVMVKGDQGTDILFIVHREIDESPETGTLGFVFFCTSFGTSDQSYDLEVRLCSYATLCYNMVGACAVNLLDHRKKTSFERDSLCLPCFRSGAEQTDIPVEVHLRLDVDSDDVLLRNS